MKNLKSIDVDNKKVLVRVDFNVPLTQDLGVKDDFRIKSHLETIKYLKENNAKIILISHLGSPKGREISLSLKPVADKLEEISSYKVKFVEDVIGEKVEKMVNELDAGDILLLENLRFYNEEEENNSEFAASIARLGDIFIEDAFSVCHREHASTASIPKFLDSYAGLLLEKEIKALDEVLEKAKHPFVAIIGGAKIITKTTVIEKLLEKADAILLAGAIANTVLKFKGIYGENELKEENIFEAIKNINFDDPKLIVPIDGIISKGNYSRVGGIETIKTGEEVVDIGPETIDNYKDIIKRARTIIWNGPIGKIENEVFAKGTKEIADAVAAQEAFSVIGGGETVDFINNEKISDKFSFISSGGGAMLDYIAGKKLPGIEAINKYYER
ncbi:MAG TPA: phosphoglycerate kinase [Candidatus Pacearchaeota archaeon]|nr:phosphoglycerate kinase [Candidatus Pacearchaeota archaeon]